MLGGGGQIEWAFFVRPSLEKHFQYLVIERFLSISQNLILALNIEFDLTPLAGTHKHEYSPLDVFGLQAWQQGMTGGSPPPPHPPIKHRLLPEGQKTVFEKRNEWVHGLLRMEQNTLKSPENPMHTERMGTDTPTWTQNKAHPNEPATSKRGDPDDPHLPLVHAVAEPVRRHGGDNFGGQGCLGRSGGRTSLLTQGGGGVGLGTSNENFSKDF